MPIFETFKIFDWVIFALVLFCAHLTKGMTGFGSLIFIIPFFTIQVGPKAAIALAIFSDIFSGLYLLSKDLKNVRYQLILPLLLFLLVGIYFGSGLLQIIPEAVLKKLIAVFIIIFSLYYIYASFQNSDAPGINRESSIAWLQTIPARVVSYLVGFAAGLIGSSIGITGPLIIVFLKRYLGKNLLRAQLVFIFFFDGLVRNSFYYYRDILTGEMIRAMLFMVPVILTAVIIGSYIHHRISEAHFTRIVGLLLLIPAIRLFF